MHHGFDTACSKGFEGLKEEHIILALLQNMRGVDLIGARMLLYCIGETESSALQSPGLLGGFYTPSNTGRCTLVQLDFASK